jgi:beta-lactam-binding protein with PASTA domain
MDPPAPPTAASVKASVALGGIVVPDVRGLPASDAREELERIGLEFAEPRAALGIPGQVLWTDPSIGRRVPADTPVTVVIGVEAERLGSAESQDRGGFSSRNLPGVSGRLVRPDAPTKV